MKSILFMGAMLAALGVAIGAFGAHGLKETLARTGYADTFETAVRYHMYHALALVALAAVAGYAPNVKTGLAALLFMAGVLLFSGSLYVLALTGIRWLGAITPLGGMCFIAGWLVVAWGAMSK